MANINQFKANLVGAGPRNNRFEVFIPRTGSKIQFLCNPKIYLFPPIRSRISRCGINVQVLCLKTKQETDFTNEYLEKGKETRYSCWN